MSLTEEQLKEFIRKNQGGKVEEIHGPSKVDGGELWEIWVYKDGEYNTRFIADYDMSEPMYLTSFQTLAAHLDNEVKNHIVRYEILEQSMKSQDVSLRRFLTYVAAAVFIGVVGVFLYIIVNVPDPDHKKILSSLTAIVTAGVGVFFWGARKQLKASSGAKV
jgi:hypothetical protein